MSDFYNEKKVRKINWSGKMTEFDFDLGGKYETIQ